MQPELPHVPANTADAVLRAARGADRSLVAGASLFDVYQGDRLPAGKSRRLKPEEEERLRRAATRPRRREQNPT